MPNFSNYAEQLAAHHGGTGRTAVLRYMLRLLFQNYGFLHPYR